MIFQKLWWGSLKSLCQLKNGYMIQFRLVRCEKRFARTLEKVLVSFERFLSFPELHSLPSCSQRKCGFEAWGLEKAKPKELQGPGAQNYWMKSTLRPDLWTSWSVYELPICLWTSRSVYELPNLSMHLLICLWTSMSFGVFKFQMFKSVGQIWIVQ